jgi:hypothetical protein
MTKKRQQLPKPTKRKASLKVMGKLRQTKTTTKISKPNKLVVRRIRRFSSKNLPERQKKVKNLWVKNLRAEKNQFRSVLHRDQKKFILVVH